MSGGGSRYVQMKSSPPSSPPAAAAEEMSSVPSFRHSGAEANRIFEELPKASIVSVSRPDASDISPMQLSYTIQVQYKQVTCHLSLRKFGILNKKKREISLIASTEADSVNQKRGKLDPNDPIFESDCFFIHCVFICAYIYTYLRMYLANSS